MNTIKFTKFVALLSQMSEMNPGVPIVKLLKEAVELKWGYKDFSDGYNNDDMLVQAMQHYVKVKKNG